MTDDDTQTSPDGPFANAPAAPSENVDTGTVRMGPFEGRYMSLFAEALEVGEISPEARQRLDAIARKFNLDPARVAAMESALLEAWETDASTTLVDPHPDTLAETEIAIEVETEAGPLPSLRDTEPPTLTEPTKPKPRAKGRRTRPADEQYKKLHARYAAAMRRGDADGAWRIADVLVHHRVATPPQRETWAKHLEVGPVRPVHALAADSWTTLLAHPDQDRITGEVFAVIASAALVGRVSAMRRDGTTPRIDPAAYQNPMTSTVSAVRALAWAAATLGMRAPPAYVAPELDVGFEILTAVPPASRIGGRALTGFAPLELAFACGRHLSWFREETFVCTLVPTVPYLETIFYAAMLLGAPSLQLPAEIHQRAHVFAQAIVPCLERPQVEKLERLVARFLSRGGRTNLVRWVKGAEATACRAGILLCGQIATAAEALSGEPGAEARVAELEAFWTSAEAGELRRRMGVAFT